MDRTYLKILNLRGSTNYEIWEIRMQAILTKRGYTDVMVPLPNKVLNTNEARILYELQSAKAVALIRLTLDDGPLL